MSIPAPMLATAGPPPEDDQLWAREMKWDGARAIIALSGSSCTIYSRNKRQLTASFPELVTALSDLADGRELLLDGEIVAPDSDGVPRFGLLQRRLHARPIPQLVQTIPAQFYAFDVLRSEGVDLTSRPYLERRAALQSLGLASRSVVTPPHWLSMPAQTLLDVAAEHHIEGIVSKRVDSAYISGRSHYWLKHPIRKTTDAVIVGYLSHHGRNDFFRSLILAGHSPDGSLTYVGCVGSGGSRALRRMVQSRLHEIAIPTSPLDVAPPDAIAQHAHWVAPKYVAEVTYREWTNTLRHSAFRGLRLDIDPSQVGLPTP
ncbi:non-homologous end-joining DNA ligase [Nocardia sp. XZ_19_369]|uniref:non-homologous end-joining DNA ligase n=1 Tax=Nocardia sp. XZ_19_369 TaxID=2769487 RepID=UPI0027D28D70|nr:non-homologous end-joining DNA ligase [Nocardia sp. XZ_19_369]